MTEEYYTSRLDNGAEAVQEMVEKWSEKHGAPPKFLILNPHAVGRKVAEVIKAAEAHGLEIKREKFVLAWEVWVGG